MASNIISNDSKSQDLEKCFDAKFYIILIQALIKEKSETKIKMKQIKDKIKLKQNIENILNDYLSSNNESLLNVIIIKILTLIGERLDRITWNKNSRECIRNKHGEFNRYQDKKSKNPIGAKLNFESLSYFFYLSDEIDDDQMADEQNFLNSNLNLDHLKNDLFILLAKLDCITINETDDSHNNELHEKQNELIKNSDISENYKTFIKKKSVNEMPSYLTDLALFVHDRKCSKKIIQLIDSYDSNVNENLKISNDLIDKYFIASLFFQTGQLFHEFSDYTLTDNNDLKNLIKNVYKIFRTNIFFYSHKLKHEKFLIDYISLFDIIKMDLRQLVRNIFDYLPNLDNIRNLNQRNETKNLLKRINFNLQSNNSQKSSNKENNAEIKLINLVKNIKEEYSNYTRFVALDDKSMYKLDAIKYSICRMGYYFAQLNDVNLLDNEYQNKENLLRMIDDFINDRRINARDVCNERNNFINERFKLHFDDKYKNIVEEFIQYFYFIKFNNSAQAQD